MVLRASRRKSLDPEYSFFALLPVETKFGFFSATLSTTAKDEISEWIRQWDYESHLRKPSVTVEIETGRLVEEYFTRLELKPGVSENEQRLELALELARKFSQGGVIIFGDRKFVDFAKEHIPHQVKNFTEVPVATRKWLTTQVSFDDKKFRASQAKVLIYDDVSNRGMDFPGVSTVIGATVCSPADYTQRVGRCGRNGRAGLAITVIRPDQYTNYRQHGDNHRQQQQQHTIQVRAYYHD